MTSCNSEFHDCKRRSYHHIAYLLIYAVLQSETLPPWSQAVNIVFSAITRRNDLEHSNHALRVLPYISTHRDGTPNNSLHTCRRGDCELQCEGRASHTAPAASAPAIGLAAITVATHAFLRTQYCLSSGVYSRVRAADPAMTLRNRIESCECNLCDECSTPVFLSRFERSEAEAAE